MNGANGIHYHTELEAHLRSSWERELDILRSTAIPRKLSPPESGVFCGLLRGAMELLFVIVACVSLLCAVTAVLQVRQIGWASGCGFSGWVTGELAVWLIGSQMIFVALCVLWIGTRSRALPSDCPAFWRPGVCWRGPSGTALMPAGLSPGAACCARRRFLESDPGDEAGQADRTDS